MTYRLDWDQGGLFAPAIFISDPRELRRRWGAWFRSPPRSSGFVWLLPGELASVHATRGTFPEAAGFLADAARFGFSIPVSGPPSGFVSGRTWVLIVHTKADGRSRRRGRPAAGVIAACMPTLVRSDAPARWTPGSRRVQV